MLNCVSIFMAIVRFNPSKSSPVAIKLRELKQKLTDFENAKTAAREKNYWAIISFLRSEHPPELSTLLSIKEREQALLVSIKSVTASARELLDDFSPYMTEAQREMALDARDYSLNESRALKTSIREIGVRLRGLRIELAGKKKRLKQRPAKMAQDAMPASAENILSFRRRRTARRRFA